MKISLLSLSALALLLAPACQGDLGLVALNDAGDLLGVSVEPGPQVDFGEVVVGADGTNAKVMIRSIGETAFLLKSISIRGEDADYFKLPDLSLPKPMLPGAEMPVMIRFMPSDPGPYNAEFWVDTDIGESEMIRRKLVATGCRDDNYDGRCDP